ncbi:MAG TPA: VOC family protein [Egibacteraceae bacterium]|nr:VOC family protein [Egibacteraceae bacterium]
MLADTTPMPTLPAADLDRARKFYEGTLGLPVAMEVPGMVLYRSGNTMLMLYESAYAGTSQATAATWNVGDFDAEVSRLRDSGVHFETYDLPDTEWDDGVATSAGGAMRAVWFKDPEGNILAVGTMPDASLAT